MKALRLTSAWSLVCLVLFGARFASATDYDGAPTVGPAKGWLIITGGGVTSNYLARRFVAMAGGPNANVVYIPTAEADRDIDLEKIRRTVPNSWGIRNLTILHTRDRIRADSDGFVEPLRRASGVIIAGGRQWRLADAYLGTAVEREIKALLARGGVVFGGSAGASIQASFLVRGAPGDRRHPDGDNRIMMSRGHERGFGLLENSAIDQHVNTREREKDLDPVIAKHPELLGIGIDESTAIIVHGDSFLVVSGPTGRQVAIHDGKKHDGNARYYFVSSGQTYNMRTRAVEQSAIAESTPRNVPAASAATPHGDTVQDSRPLVTADSTPRNIPTSTATPHEAPAQDSKYPLVLKVTAARRFARQSGTTTSGSGLLTSAADPNGTPQDIIIECDTGVYSRAGYNLYPARIDQPHQLKIAVRELGGDKMNEFTCKY